jgi:hypothetical protein
MHISYNFWWIHVVLLYTSYVQLYEQTKKGTYYAKVNFCDYFRKLHSL